MRRIVEIEAVIVETGKFCKPLAYLHMTTDRQSRGQAVASLDGSAPAAAPASAEKHSYGQILRSSALIGGTSTLNIAIGIVRTKAMALLLGPAGVGLMGLYGSILDLALSIASVGINSAGVRQIAEASSTGDRKRIARTVAVLRRTAVLLGISGAVLLAVCASQVATFTFGSEQHVGAVALLSLAVFFRLVADGQGALVQGMRRISDLAKMGVLGTLLGSIISIALVFALREDGIVPALVGGAAMGLAISWWYSRKVRTDPPAMTGPEVRQEAAALLKLGVAFMASGFLTVAAAYAVRTMVARLIDFEGAGLYQAAWTLGGLYVGIILQSMGTDFYPRLVGAAADDQQCNRLVNEQAQVSLLLAGPGVLATLTFAPLVIALFYSARFVEAVDLLRWICLGIALRVITWPMGYIIVAKNKRVLFVAADLAWTLVNVALTWLCLGWFGLNGAGIAFFGSYAFHALMIYPMVRWLSGFRWSAANRRIGLLFLSSIAFVFCGFYALPPLLAIGVGALVTILSSVYALRVLVSLVHRDSIPRPILRLLELGRSAR